MTLSQFGTPWLQKWDLHPERNQRRVQGHVGFDRHASSEQAFRVNRQPELFEVGEDLPVPADTPLCSGLYRETEVVMYVEPRHGGIVILEDDGIRYSGSGVRPKGTPCS